MGDGSRIEWTDATWNPLIGCTKVGPGCDHCYAIGVVHRGMSAQHRGLTVRAEGGTDWTGEVREVSHLLDQPLRWKRPRRIFVNSLSDLFHPEVRAEFIADVFAVMALAPQHTFQVLTKRPVRMAALLADDNDYFQSLYEHALRERGANAHFLPPRPLPNVWLGTSIESNRYAFRADALRATPAAVRWVSAEPLLGPLDDLDLTGIDWLVVGGESGPGARPMHPQWVRDLRDRCGDTAFHFKQWGAWGPTGRRGLGASHPDRNRVVAPLDDRGLAEEIERVGKRAAGRELDGRTWDEWPSAAALIGDPE